MKYRMGVVGLGVMGASLARNIESKGFPVAGYDLDQARARAFLEGPARGRNIIAVDKAEALMTALERPRRVLMMVPAGAPVDSVIAHLKPHLEAGDILIDGGNSHFADTDRRSDELAALGFHFVGAGVSGGEEGALHGPSIMPGGPRAAWDALADILRAIAARAEDGEPCVDYIGPRGAGHYVKMVHNGIEYGDMQLIAETYDLLRRSGLTAPQIASVFADWNRGELRSYLIEITADLLQRTDEQTGEPLVDVILDEAEQKGTGRWTVKSALDLGVPVTGIAEAVFARALSGSVVQRRATTGLASGTLGEKPGDAAKFVEDVRQALYASKIIAYAQGFNQIQAGSEEYNWGITPGDLATIWRGGCIIRAKFLNRIKEAYDEEPELATLIVAPYFRSAVEAAVDGWRRVVVTATQLGIPIPGFSSALSYYDALRTERLPAALTQGLRDFFGAHTYGRIDADPAARFHTLWSGDRSEVEA